MRIKYKVHAIKLALTAEAAGRLHSALQTNSSDEYEPIKFTICFLYRIFSVGFLVARVGASERRWNFGNLVAFIFLWHSPTESMR